MSEACRLLLASRFVDMGYGSDGTMKSYWQTGKVAMICLYGIWCELEPLLADDGEGLLLPFKLNGKHVVHFKKSDTLFKGISRDGLIEAWSKHVVIARIIRRHLVQIEAHLWEIPRGAMIQRLWREINH